MTTITDDHGQRHHDGQQRSPDAQRQPAQVHPVRAAAHHLDRRLGRERRHGGCAARGLFGRRTGVFQIEKRPESS